MITRRRFAQTGAGLALTSLGTTVHPAEPPRPAGAICPDKATETIAPFGSLQLRPYQLLCIICRLGEGRTDDLGEARLTEILRIVRGDRRTPVTLRCNVDMIYRYQNPGSAEDTPEGALFNAKRDLDILQRLGLAPGDTRPAIDLFARVLANIPESKGICGNPDGASLTWRGCARAGRGHYERGCALKIGGIFPPRAPAEKAEFKKRSAAAVYAAKELRLRPHHLLCMSCFYGRKTRLAPIQEDNLFEAIDAIGKNPALPVRLIAGCCMICPPCSAYDPASNLCLGGRSMALRDMKKDLDTLARLDLNYGDVLPARALYELLYARIASPIEICGYGDGRERAPEWSVCGSARDDAAYRKARADMLGIKPRDG